MLHEQSNTSLSLNTTRCRYASSVSQEEEQLDLLRPRGQAVGTELAAAWLAERFALPESIGTQQLCQDVACLQCGTSPRATSTGRNNFPALRCDELAQALVGLTDSCFSHMQSAFDSTCFVPHVIHQLWLMVIQLLPETSSRNSSASACGMTAVRFEGSDPQWAFIGGVCAKLCRRGFVSEVAQSLWQHCLQQHQAASDQVTVSSSPADEQQQQHQQQSQSPSHSEHTAHAQSDNATGDRQHLPQTAKPAHNTLCEILLAIKDSDATEKLLTALLLQAGQDPNQSRALLLMRTVISPQWDRKHIRQVYQCYLVGF